MKKAPFKRKRLWFCLGAFLILTIVSLFFWYTKPEEVTKAVSKEELIASNKSWIKTNPAIPLTNREIATLPIAHTKAYIDKSGDMIFETTNPRVITSMTKSNSLYSGMKAYRLRIFAHKVAEYMTNNKYKMPTDKVASKALTKYKIEEGNRFIRSDEKPIHITHKKGEITANTKLPVLVGKASDKKAIKSLPLGIDSSTDTIYFKDSFRASASFVTAYPKVFAYKFTLQQKMMELFRTQKVVSIKEPIGVEYVMK